ncbi:MAG: hypothetical protein JJT85_00375 [Chromatiales bacterium]|nr:hypothetical protein [Chromatiales bacterium]
MNATPISPVERMQRAEPGLERISLQYLPQSVAGYFEEALACYGHGLWKAFAAMSRLTAEAVFADLGEPGRLRVFDLVQEVQVLAGLDNESFAIVRQVIFSEHPASRPPAEISHRDAALLLETLKDVLHQVYVRRARLQQALKVRQFFASGGDTAP